MVPGALIQPTPWALSECARGGASGSGWRRQRGRIAAVAKRLLSLLGESERLA